MTDQPPPRPGPMTPAARGYLAELKRLKVGADSMSTLLALVEAQAVPPPQALARALHTVLANRAAIVMPDSGWELAAAQALGLIQVWRLQALEREAQAGSPQVVPSVETPDVNGD